MDEQRIYRKTDKGQEAIAARLHGLVGRGRTLLILVDGKRELTELQRLAGGLGDIAQMLQTLALDGFIAPTAGAPPTMRASPATVAAPANGAYAAASDDLAAARAVACHRLIEMLGPTADPLCMQIDATRNLPDFVAAVQRAYATVHEVRGHTQAERYGAAVEAAMPPPA